MCTFQPTVRNANHGVPLLVMNTCVLCKEDTLISLWRQHQSTLMCKQYQPQHTPLPLPAWQSALHSEWSLGTASYRPDRQSEVSPVTQTERENSGVHCYYTGCRFVRYPQHLSTWNAICHKNPKFTSHFVKLHDVV